MSTTLEIMSVVHGGHGLARIDGEVCFVPGGLPGDELEVRIRDRKRGVAWGDIERIVTPSPDRVTPDCPVFGTCGGCSWLHFAYPAQAEWKRRLVADCLTRIGRIEVDLELREDPAFRFGYRTRARFHATGGRVGYYGEASRDIVDIETCPLCHPRLNDALVRLHHPEVEGDVEVVVNPEGPEQLVWAKRPSAVLKELFPDPPESQHARRPHFLFDGRPIVAGTFSQSSLLLNRLLVREVELLATDAERVLDLYCGNGNLSLGLADRCEVLGLDHEEAALTPADALRPEAYQLGGEPEFVAAIEEGGRDTIVLDPPRTGARGIIPALKTCDAARIIYVACDPATLARDLKELAAADWQVDRAAVLDLFPHTPHVETLVRLSR